MSIGLIGKKVGMTRVFNEDGSATAVTVIDVSDNVFLQKKTEEKNGYSAVQVAFDDQKEARVNRPMTGRFKANSSSPKRVIREFRVENDEKISGDIEHPGMNLFEEGQWVDVIGTSKGKGFQGVVKRFGYGGLPQSHGSMMHRRPGGVGAGTTPGRIWKNKPMPGRHGNYNRTIQNLRIVKLRPDDNVILVSGAVPGAKGGYVIIRPAVKHERPEQDLTKKEEEPVAEAEEETPQDEAAPEEAPKEEAAAEEAAPEEPAEPAESEEKAAEPEAKEAEEEPAAEAEEAPEAKAEEEDKAGEEPAESDSDAEEDGKDKE